MAKTGSRRVYFQEVNVSPGVHVRARALCAVNTMSCDKIASAVISQDVYNALSKASEVTLYENTFYRQIYKTLMAAAVDV